MQDIAECEAAYFDGITSRRHNVTLRLGTSLGIVEDGTILADWPFNQVRRVDGPPGKLRLGSTSAAPLARIEVGDAEAMAALLTRCKDLDVGRHSARQTWRIVFWSAAAACSIMALVVYGLPFAADRLAPLVPRSVEQRIGQAVDAQVRALIDARICDGAAGQAALSSMAEKIRIAGGMAHSLDAHVLSSSTANAIALPGGKIYLFDGLLQKARSADEIAGVLAHEIGHGHHLHIVRSIIHNGGTSFLIGLLLGDIVGSSAVIFASTTLLQASHSREAEQEADAFSFAVMRALGRSPVPMAELLLRITGEQGKQLGGFTILDSHPLTESRLATAKQNDGPVTGPPILSTAEWDALKAICKEK